MPRKKAAAPAAKPCPQCGYLPDASAGPLNFCPACGASLERGASMRPSAAPAGPVSQVIADRYRLLELIGEGGMGSVYKAEHIRMGKALALKILRGDFAREEGAVERFLAEARIVSRLSHPHTIGVFDFGEVGGADGGFYLAMEYVPGKDLARVLHDGGPVGEARAAEIGQQVLGALAEAHDAGIVHRDMKPGNVMLMLTRSGDDFAKVLDFGIAKLREEGGVTTSAGAIVGTPNYLPPEQARGDAVDARSDLYALGCVLYELVAGRPPFVAPNPMAVVSAHLSQPPPPLASVAPAVSRRFAEIVHRALAKRPAERFASADDMRDALLQLGEEPTGSRPVARVGAPEMTGALEIASREDFEALDRKVRPLRPSRVLPALLVLLVAAGGAAVWRAADLYALLAARAPRVAALLPPALRPSGVYDGVEHEPNDTPAQANPLPLPPGPDGSAAGGVAKVTGHVGARIDERTGDVDLYRVDVPPAVGTGKILVATWRGEREGSGIRGLDVVLTLNRAPAATDPRATAPLVATSSHGGPGAPERLTAAVQPGRYYLAVREQHDDATGPVEKPTDDYVLEVRLADPTPGEELEPNDAPERVPGRAQRYADWRALASRNALVPGAALRGETAPDDFDTLSVPAHASAPRLVALVPVPALALEARRWIPDDEDLSDAPAGGEDRVRFEAPGEGAPGAVVLVRLEPPRPGAPALVLVRATEGAGAYTALALGSDPASGTAALGLVQTLAAAGRTAAALELAAGYATLVPDGAARAEVLLAAGKLAEGAAAALSAVDAGAFERVTALLGEALFEPGADGKVHYRAAFERRVDGAGRAAEEAALRAAALASPCTAAEVAARAGAFLARAPAPAPELAAQARRLRARAAEEAFLAGGATDAALRAAALDAWTAVAAEGGADAHLAQARAAALSANPPARGDAQPPVCP